MWSLWKGRRKKPRIVSSIISFWYHEALCAVTMSWSSLSWLTTTHSTLKSIWKLQLMQSTAAQRFLGAPQAAHITLLGELHYCRSNSRCWLTSLKPFMFRTSEEPSIPMGLACPAPAEEAYFRSCLSKNFGLWGPREDTSVAPALSNILLSEVRSRPTWLAFWKSLKVWCPDWGDCHLLEMTDRIDKRAPPVPFCVTCPLDF